MIPVSDVKPEVPSPLPTSRMPARDEITEEGFGAFRGTWYIGRAPLAHAEAILKEETEIIDWLDEVAREPNDFEQLASAIEQQEPDLIAKPLRSMAMRRGLRRFLNDEQVGPLDGLEVGVAGLVYALSVIRCLTAASCRWHITEHSWSDAPVVMFVARPWRIEILADLVAAADCGIGVDLHHDTLAVYGRSIRDTHRLANSILAQRGRFRRTGTRLALSVNIG